MKDELRQAIVAKRNALTADEVACKTAAILQRLRQLVPFQRAQDLLIYLDFRNEVRTDGLIRELLDTNRKVYIPVTNPASHTLTISQLVEPDQDLVRSHFGLLEPHPDALRPVDPATIDLVIVPGIVFDRKGYRIGFGAGYYDRFLATLSTSIPLISLIYEFQLVDRIPKEAHDIPVHILVTENRIIDCT